MDERIFKDLIISLNAKLDTIIKLMVLLKTEDKNQSEMIWLLSSAGVQPKDIAEMLGTTSNTVRVALSVLRKQKKKGKKIYLKEEEIDNG